MANQVVLINNVVVFTGETVAAMAFASEHKLERPAVLSQASYQAQLERIAVAQAAPVIKGKKTKAHNDVIKVLEAGQMPDGLIMEAVDYLCAHGKAKFNIIKLAKANRPLTAKQIAWIFSTMADIKGIEAAVKRTVNRVHA